MADRLQWEKFWYRDFCDDLKICSAQTRGFWISFLSYLWGNGGIGEFTGSIEDFSRISSCTILEVESSINEIEIKKICEVQHQSNATVTLINRRLKSEEIERENTRLRVNKWRKKANVTRHEQASNGVEERRKKKEERRIKEGAPSPQGSMPLPSKDELENFSEPKLLEQINEISEKLYQENIFPKVNAFVNLLKKKKKNLRAILHALCRIYLSKPEEPWAFGLKISEVEDGKYNARDYEKTT